MLLDEMNLARVEYYFSDWLACTESRRWMADGTIRQQAVPLHRSHAPMVATQVESGGALKTFSVPASLEPPTNVVVTGTVNVDETTHGFSPKVLDRAMVIEFDDVDLDRLRNGAPAQTGNNFQLPEDLPPFRLATREDFAALPPTLHDQLVAINGILEEARLHFGYRAANEMALFMGIYNTMLPAGTPDPDWERALDIAVLQKVLPRLSGNRSKLEAPLVKLCAYLRDLAISQHCQPIRISTRARKLVSSSRCDGNAVFAARLRLRFVLQVGDWPCLRRPLPSVIADDTATLLNRSLGLVSR